MFRHLSFCLSGVCQFAKGWIIDCTMLTSLKGWILPPPSARDANFPPWWSDSLKGLNFASHQMLNHKTPHTTEVPLLGNSGKKPAKIFDFFRFFRHSSRTPRDTNIKFQSHPSNSKNFSQSGPQLAEKSTVPSGHLGHFGPLRTTFSTVKPSISQPISRFQRYALPAMPNVTSESFVAIGQPSSD